MMTWPEVQFETLFSEPQRNGLYKEKQFHGSGAKIVNMGELFAYRFLGSQDMQRVQISDTEYRRFGLQDGDLLFARRSLIESGAGKCVIVEGVKEEMVFESSLIRVRLAQERCSSRFYLYYFSCPPGRSRVEAIITGAAQKGIRGTDLARIIVHLPPLATQQKIAAILSAYDDLIENNLQRIKILEEMAQNLYREWFARFRFLGHQHARFVDSPLGRIPEAWEVVPLGKLTELRKDKFKEALHSECPLLDLAKMQQQTLSVGETGNPSELTTSRIVFEEDDILFGSIRPYLHKVALAPCRGVTNVSVLVVRSAEKTLQSFLAVLLSSIDAIRWADQHSTGTKMPVIKWEVLRTMPVLLPSQAVLGSFETSVQPMLQTVKMASSRNQNLRRTRDLLLPRLISGEVDVSELDIAVPDQAGA
ncbi:restriction endonuclease subunit S [Candidatus Cryosericum septentrionale]|jgi:type I restriction enzyme S subunit|uniref:Restriction endonuclease subunit S n=1 Tax=Candidatus Cryosericum septentrionale TaxID=2290913 RepID=A0A398DKA5_9BACT|nr:restriction endonuclease subunit S [Candidatus Cryosericum septentrionale]RIE16106.1 restriction endonuclease subunit S [Candidatus Cryosericum septentrionale]